MSGCNCQLLRFLVTFSFSVQGRRGQIAFFHPFVDAAKSALNISVSPNVEPKVDVEKG